ncbi:chaperonin CPN60-1, mitochondrial-like [Ipomoea triloba]|uniref:chaperonin CPN60-1, mitochondrial-like n=1 Tax=Ipomoea triloba TaxID=35885 RepID=UPI00125E4948|nr:chaperonin CPN60-1, mitochondrial-like [Ipomoea triloba]XP_031093709.1 chaperonin CPN60-1, mitochondrial-like [Ipomoea triloba]XP_031108247.1 chaperonin CPN60-1, mitochondrial-like [Ipomoea triloba]
MKLDRGYITPYFITNQKNINVINAIVKILELPMKRQRPFFIIAEDVDNNALATLMLDKLRVGIKVGENRKANLQDLATLTGGQLAYSYANESSY